MSNRFVEKAIKRSISKKNKNKTLVAVQMLFKIQFTSFYRQVSLSFLNTEIVKGVYVLSFKCQTDMA